MAGDKAMGSSHAVLLYDYFGLDCDGAKCLEHQNMGLLSCHLSVWQAGEGQGHDLFCDLVMDGLGLDIISDNDHAAI